MTVLSPRRTFRTVLGPLLSLALLAAGTASPAWAAGSAAGPESPAPAPEARGDAAWAHRAEGFAETGRVAEAPAREAVAAYEEALAANPEDLALRVKLLRALYFLGHFATTDPKQAKQISNRGVEVSREGVEQVERAAGGEAELDALPLEERGRRLAGVAGAREAYFWDAVSWGLWGLNHSLLASARRGVPGAIRDDARLVNLLDEGFGDAGGLRLLGRLHTKIPQVALVSPWVDPAEGIALLRRAREISNRDPRNALFLAEALLEHRPGSEPEALALLRQVSRRVPNPERLVEETEVVEEARRELDRLETRLRAATPAGEAREASPAGGAEGAPAASGSLP
jgi:hypothetical protein